MNKEQALKVALDYFKGYPSKNDVVITTDGAAFHSDNGGAARIHQERFGGVSFRITRKETEASEVNTSSDVMGLPESLDLLVEAGLSDAIKIKFEKAGKIDPALLTEKQKAEFLLVYAKVDVYSSSPLSTEETKTEGTLPEVTPAATETKTEETAPEVAPTATETKTEETSPEVTPAATETKPEETSTEVAPGANETKTEETSTEVAPAVNENN